MVSDKMPRYLLWIKTQLGLWPQVVYGNPEGSDGQSLLKAWYRDGSVVAKQLLKEGDPDNLHELATLYPYFESVSEQPGRVVAGTPE